MDNNKDRRLTDIRKPNRSGVNSNGHKFDLSPSDELRDDFSRRRPGRKVFPKGTIWGVFFLVGVFVVSLFFSFRGASERAADSLLESLNQLSAGVAELRALETKSAEKNFSEAGDGIGVILENLPKSVRPLFGGVSDALTGFQQLAAQGVILAQEMDFLEDNLLTLYLNQGGDEIVSSLEKIQKSLSEIQTQGELFSSNITKLNEVSPYAGEFYLPLKLDITRFQKFLNALVLWVKSDEPRRLFVLFQNPSEIRPAGGFLGSYAVVTINNASMESVDIHDINDVDRKLELNLVPPTPLQVIAKSWGVAGANWFFDFTKSAEKVIELAEESKLYADTGVEFDGAVAISPKVISDILSLTGPLELDDGDLVFDEDNFLIEIQKQVQLGQEERATYPKDILRELSPIFLSKVASLGDSEKRQLFAFAAEWLEKKDIMFYLKNQDIENFVDYYGASGRVYELPSNFEGDYLSIVDANIGGGKSDLFIEQDVALTSQINLDGSINNHLVIDRKHEGGKSKYWWYRVMNQNYIQIFIPPSSQISNFKGGFEKKITPPLNYASKGYSTDPMVSEIESGTEKLFNYPALSSHGESGKKVFSTWSRTKRGEKTQLVFDYTNKLPLPPEDGTAYQFVFEKQAGTNRDYKFEINAPVGFRFRENNLPVFTYESDDPPGRLILNLILERI